MNELVEDISGKQELLDFDRDELASYLSAQFNAPSFRAKQLIRWIHKHGALDFSPMTDIAKEFRQALEGHFSIFRPEKVETQQSIDGTRKYLFRLRDGSQIESVLIKQPTRYTLCVSSQVGCAIGCTFCRTGLMGLRRNLDTHEIVGQVLAVKDDIRELQFEGEPVDFNNIVFMGMGEPLQNVDNVLRSLRLLHDELGHDFSSRKVTVSTSGLIPAIKKFGEEGGLNHSSLAVSLNATTNEVRTKIMPLNKRWPIEDLLATLKELPLKKNQRITFEYVMLAGVNDTQQDLERLPKLLAGIPSKVNLIPYNENAGLGFKSPSRNKVFKWQDALLSKGLNSTIRWSKGDDISAACGQLATETGRKQKASKA